MRQRYDAAIARAVAELRVLAELCLPLVRPGGHWVAAKGAAPADEVQAAGRAISKLGGELAGVELVDSGAQVEGGREWRPGWLPCLAMSCRACSPACLPVHCCCACRVSVAPTAGAVRPRPPSPAEAPEGWRTAVVVRKPRPTPREFPRRPGTPAKKPL